MPGAWKALGDCCLELRQPVAEIVGDPGDQSAQGLVEKVDGAGFGCTRRVRRREYARRNRDDFTSLVAAEVLVGRAFVAGNLLFCDRGTLAPGTPARSKVPPARAPEPCRNRRRLKFSRVIAYPPKFDSRRYHSLPPTAPCLNPALGKSPNPLSRCCYDLRHA